jgi:surface antigen
MGKMRFGTSAIAALVALVLAGCTTTGGGSAGSVKAGSAVYISALQGGIVSRTGVKLSNSETQRALEAEYRALEAAPGGQPVTWAGGDVRGEVIAAAPYQVGKQNCRQFTHKVVNGNRTLEARGAACRNANGTWTPLS